MYTPSWLFLFTALRHETDNSVLLTDQNVLWPEQYHKRNISQQQRPMF